MHNLLKKFTDQLSSEIEYIRSLSREKTLISIISKQFFYLCEGFFGNLNLFTLKKSTFENELE